MTAFAAATPLSLPHPLAMRGALFLLVAGLGLAGAIGAAGGAVCQHPAMTVADVALPGAAAPA